MANDVLGSSQDNSQIRRRAFVAMKYSSDPWRDKIYRVIADCLQEANIEPIRADAIRSSEGSAGEVLKMLEDADMVVIDTSGDSLSVAYELGYCHGIRKRAEDVPLMRKQSAGENSFAYRHYRWLYYNDMRHLRRLLRERFAMSRPLSDSQLGMAFHLARVNKDEPAYGAQAAAAVVDTLAQAQFSGRCEYYAADGMIFGEPDAYVVGLGLRYSRSGRDPTYQWWMRFGARLRVRFRELDANLEVDTVRSEMGELFGIKSWYLHRGTAEFEGGQPTRMLERAKADSWFSSEIAQRVRRLVTPIGHAEAASKDGCQTGVGD